MKKIVIAYATAGIGHKKAAIAIKAAFDEMAGKDAEVEIIDSLDYTNAFFKWVYLKFYLLMVNKLPLFWGLLYYLTDNPFLNLIISKIRNLSNRLNSKKLVNYLISSKPDVIITTHFFPSEIISDLKGKGIVDPLLISVVTDYRLHSWWVSNFVDMYVVGSEDAKSDLLGWKVDPAKIKILGIPVEPIFSKKLDREKILVKNSFKEEIFTILVIGGGFGVGPIEDIIKVAGDIALPIQIITICGHNKELVKRLEEVKKGLKAGINVLGFVDNVYEYMEIADILISKSGGITVAESLAKELPMIVISPILGQETRNAGFLIKYGAAFKVKKFSDLKEILEDLISHPEKMAKMKEAIHNIKRPTACYDVVKLALGGRQGS